MHTIADLNSGALAGVTRLRISESLTEFPTEIFGLADTLETLDLSGNKLSRLPMDFGRLHKLKILFMSDNDFEVLPGVLAGCPALSMIGFKANRIHTVPENALPVDTRWLILTDNKIDALPDSMGSLHKLQKLMLAGNRLTTLPEPMQKCSALELVRISANNFSAMPEFLLQLPKLAWVAFSGNPFCQVFDKPTLRNVGFDDLALGQELGEGASGVISKATWLTTPDGLENTDGPVAVKTFKGEVTSDGYPQDELSACVAAGKHVNLVELIAQIEDAHGLGLVMALIDDSFSNLGEPPTLQSCTRDHFRDEFSLTTAAVIKIVRCVADTMIHLHLKGISHGDLYAHNILINEEADVLFGDFGAASNYLSVSSEQAEALQGVEVRAFGCLLEDLLAIGCDSDDFRGAVDRLDFLKHRCMDPKGCSRPTFAEIRSDLISIGEEHSRPGHR